MERPLGNALYNCHFSGILKILLGAISNSRKIWNKGTMTLLND